MKEGITMANRNGMGPLNQGQLTGRGLGNCATGNNIGKIGLGIGAGLGMAWRCRKGLGRGARGLWQNSPLDVKESLVHYKEQLKQELANIEKQLIDSKNE